MRTQARVGRPVALVAALAVGYSACFLDPPDDCIAGLHVGDRLVLRLIEPYTEGSRFAYRQPVGSPLPPWCRTADIVTPMDVPLVVLRRVDYTNSCFVWVVEADVPMVTSFDPGTRIGALGVEAHGELQGTCPNLWRLTATPGIAGDVIDVVAVPGQIPPVIASRALNGECFASASGGCEDYYAAELHRE